MKRRTPRFAGTIPTIAIICTMAAAIGCSASQDKPTSSSAPQPPPTVSPQQIQTYCAHCHAYPPPDSFPRSAWKEEVEKAYKLIGLSQMDRRARRVPAPPPLEQVVQYFEERAKPELPPADIVPAATPLALRFQPQSYPPPPQIRAPAISNVNLVHLFDERRLDVLACDMRAGRVMALRPYESAPQWRMLGSVPHPCHTEVIDLDGDGVKDILVANLGSMEPMDHSNGSVVWLRGQRDGGFTVVPLLEGIGRVADVQAADFRGIGRLDLVVAEFGWFHTGRILYLENQTADWSHPVFVPRELDERHGGIHVPVTDLNGDGRPDFVALLGQEHETIVAFVNQGGGAFRQETIYTAPHPAYGSSGIQLVDMNGDGRVDVLYTNGDTMDPPYLLKPYHGIQWLENQGSFPFVHHPIAPMYGVHRAVAADFRGCGRLDIMAVSYLPPDRFPQRKERNLDAVIYLEQTTPGQFARHSLKTVHCDHATCCAGDIFGSGRIDLATGDLLFHPSDQAIVIWKNQGRATREAAPNQTVPRP
ncbi:MAG: FG-GAP repeat domain-containing protein [Gemmataceae bacterium]